MTFFQVLKPGNVEPLYVVTFKMEYHDGSTVVTEFYRGSRDECGRIASSFLFYDPVGSDDRRRIKCTDAQVGSLADWEQFLADCNA